MYELLCGLNLIFFVADTNSIITTSINAFEIQTNLLSTEQLLFLYAAATNHTIHKKQKKEHSFHVETMVFDQNLIKFCPPHEYKKTSR